MTTLTNMNARILYLILVGLFTSVKFFIGYESVYE
jgi:hypothetical protein